MKGATRLGIAALCLIGAISTASIYPNGFAQDDIPIIERNARVQSLDRPGRFFTESYWPEPYDPALYRPLASLGYAMQWAAGGGRPLLFRVVSVALVILGGLAFYRLARILVPEPIAWLTAALFVVHPVHVEAIAAAVNQSELAVGLLALTIVAGYLEHRARPRRWFVPRLFLTFLAALLFKETAAVLLLVVLAAEILLVRDPAPLAARLARIRPTVLGMILGVVVFIAVRGAALGGNLLGTFVAEAFEGKSMLDRGVIMLGVVPHWLRLLAWPAHLRADYSPQEIDPSVVWGASQYLGVAIVVAALALIRLSWRRAPVVAFGLLWTGLALGPVSNVLVPTGIVLAERTLFLPSIGFLLAVAGALAWTWDRFGSSWFRHALVAAGLLLIGLGCSRSFSRYRVWRSNEAYWRQAVVDAPKSYRAGHAFAQLLFASGDRTGAEREFRRAVALYPKAWDVYLAHANRLRLAGLCADAVVFYDRTLIVKPATPAARNGLIACLVYDGRYREASAAAAEGIRVAARPAEARLFTRFQAIADSADAAGAPPRSVLLRIRAADTLP